MKLYFIRHGKASYDAPSDELRPLLPEGVQQAQDLGHLFKKLGVHPSKIYTSPRLRAKETAAEIGKILNAVPEITEACNFEFSFNKALELARLYDSEAEILFVGHNPSMSDAITAATGAVVDLSTGGAACVARVSHQSSSAMLKWLITAKVSAVLSE